MLGKQRSAELSPSRQPEPPEPLLWPLRLRAERLADGWLDDIGWRAQAHEWATYADGRYNACVDLRPPTAAGDPLRVGVKDTLDVAGFPTRLGLRRYRHHPARTAAVLRGLPAPSVVAKLVTTEINIGREHGCVNPYFPHLDPAGSSTGAAVAVAAAICDLAVGTDSVGSVRLPAAACGVVGLRLTHDERHFVDAFRSSALLDAPGLVTRTADDLAYVWRQRWFGAGADRRAGGARRPDSAFRIGVVAEAVQSGRSPEVAAAQEMLLSTLAGAGHQVRPVRLGDQIWRWRASVYELVARHAWDTCRHWPDAVTGQFTASTSLALEQGAAVTDQRLADIVAALRRVRAAAPGRFVDDDVDLWLLPVGPRPPRNVHTTAPPASTIPDPAARDDPRLGGYVSVASLAGLPAITFPVVEEAALGAPIEMQAVGPPHSEPVLIAFAQAVAGLLGGPTFRWGPPPPRPVAQVGAW